MQQVLPSRFLIHGTIGEPAAHQVDREYPVVVPAAGADVCVIIHAFGRRAAVGTHMRSSSSENSCCTRSTGGGAMGGELASPPLGSSSIASSSSIRRFFTSAMSKRGHQCRGGLGAKQCKSSIEGDPPCLDPLLNQCQLSIPQAHWRLRRLCLVFLPALRPHCVLLSFHYQLCS